MQIRRRRGPRRADPAPAAPSEAGGHVGQTRGGYRLVRLLGVGRRASVYLGHADAPPGSQDASSVAVKVFHATVPESAVDAEIDALARSDHPHTVRLLDVATGDDGRPCLILERLPGGSLSRLVSDRERIGPGEAVTILAPLLAAVDELHRSGVAHGALRLSSVLFRASGAPVVCGFGAAAPTAAAQSEAALARDPLVVSDREALLTVVRAVLARVPGQAAADLAQSLPEAPAAIDPAKLFALAEPAPVRLGPTDVVDRVEEGERARAAAVRQAVPERAGAGLRRDERTGAGLRRDERTAAEQRAAGSSAAVRTAAGRAGAGRAGAGHRAGGAPRAHAARAASWLAGQARQVRPRFWALGAAVAASVLAALVLVPPTDTATEGAVPREPSTAGVPGTNQEQEDQPSLGAAGAGTEPPADEVGGYSSGAHSADDPASSDDPVPADAPVPVDESVPAVDPVLSDDPVAALGALLAERERCLRDLSVLCLDGVLQGGSAAMERDAAIVRSIQGGGETPPEAEIAAGELALVERLGDSALVSLGTAGPDPPGQSKPASALVMRGEAGWRIRDYL